MPPKRSFDVELITLEALRHVTPEAAQSTIVKTLTHSNNFIVAKAATLAQHHHLTDLIPDLAAAFPRFLEDPYVTDPQCWAKNAIAKTLAAFEYQGPTLFLLGLRHYQPEPVWGGTQDSAGPLRGTCALALVQCRTLSSHKLLLYLTPLFADQDATVRTNAIRAVEQVGSDSAALLLRLRAELAYATPEFLQSPENLAACYSGVLALEGLAALPWAANFLTPENDASAEAAMAIAETHTPEAFLTLKAAHAGARDPWFRAAVLSAIALTRQPEATTFLLDLVRKDSRDARDAHEALCRSAPGAETLARLRELGRPCFQSNDPYSHSAYS